MTYYINPIWFYWMNVLEGMKIFLCCLSSISLIIFVFVLIAWAIDGCADITDLDEDEKKTVNLFKKIIIASFISLLIGILTPAKETCIEMMIASQVTHENVADTKEEIYEIIDYITDKVNGDKECE